MYLVFREHALRLPVDLNVTRAMNLNMLAKFHYLPRAALRGCACPQMIRFYRACGGRSRGGIPSAIEESELNTRELALQ
jgi:hypothetical protein